VEESSLGIFNQNHYFSRSYSVLRENILHILLLVIKCAKKVATSFPCAFLPKPSEKQQAGKHTYVCEDCTLVEGYYPDLRIFVECSICTLSLGDPMHISTYVFESPKEIKNQKKSAS